MQEIHRSAMVFSTIDRDSQTLGAKNAATHGLASPVQREAIYSEWTV